MMGSSDFSKSGGQEAAQAVQYSETTKLGMLASAQFSASPVDESPHATFFSIPIGAFYDKLPEPLLRPKRPDLARLINIAWEDVILDPDTKEATILLSILSLSCPEIFARPVESADDITITFSVGQAKAEPGRDGFCAEIATESNAQRVPGESATLESPIGKGETAAAEAQKKDTIAASNEIKVKLGPILENLPPEIELFPPPTIGDPETEIALPIDLVKSQLKDGRVEIAASLLCAALPEDLKSIFGKIEPAVAIPIPLREIFRKLSLDTIELREDYALGYSLETIRTPFTIQAEEDALRFGAKPGGSMGPPAGSECKSAPEISRVPADINRVAQEADKTKARVADPVPLPVAEVEFPAIFDSLALQSLLMTEEILDLAKTIQKVSELPGLRSCLLTTTQGAKLAGELVGPIKETAFASELPRLFQQIKSAMGEARSLEGITLYFNPDPLSIILVNELCLFVAHDSRPFHPGVREKIFSVVQELDAISHSKKRS
jgi:hypothetical protein